MNSAALAKRITQRAKSNLALAFCALPAERRRDIRVFYAFCRLIDDIADAPGVAADEKLRQLAAWRRALGERFAGEPALAGPVREVLAKYGVRPELPREIIAGCEMDVRGARFETFDDLRLYCHRVAGAVGLVSIVLFGCRHPASEPCAEALGLALQLTNILRDVARDYANGGRLYLPRTEMALFGVTEASLAAREYSAAFVSLMDFQAVRALCFYAQAERLMPAADWRALVAARIMAAIYRHLLTTMRRDRFRVFAKDYAVGRLTKARLVAGILLRHWLGSGDRRVSGGDAQP